jgi:hypothetical protein
MSKKRGRMKQKKKHKRKNKGQKGFIKDFYDSSILEEFQNE